MTFADDLVAGGELVAMHCQVVLQCLMRHLVPRHLAAIHVRKTGSAGQQQGMHVMMLATLPLFRHPQWRISMRDVHNLKVHSR